MSILRADSCMLLRINRSKSSFRSKCHLSVRIVVSINDFGIQIFIHETIKTKIRALQNAYLQKHNGRTDHRKTSFEYTNLQVCTFLTKNLNTALVSFKQNNGFFECAQFSLGSAELLNTSFKKYSPSHYLRLTISRLNLIQ